MFIFIMVPYVLMLTVFLRAATKWILKRDVTFGLAIGTVSLAQILTCIIYFPLKQMIGEDGTTAFILIITPVSVIIHVLIIAKMLEISYKRSFIVFVVMSSIWLVIILPVILIVLFGNGGYLNP